MNQNLVWKLLYQYNKEEVLENIKSIDDERVLFVFMYNYNWDNGFQIPNLILKKECCTLSIAMLIFFNADGIAYLQNKNNRKLSEWFDFIEQLYKNIVQKKYIVGIVGYKIPLTKVQLFKLRRELSSEEQIFLNDIPGTNEDILIN